MPISSRGWLQLERGALLMPFLIYPLTTVVGLPTVKFKDGQANYTFEAGKTAEISFYLSLNDAKTQDMEIIVQHEKGDHFERQCLLKLQPLNGCETIYPLCRCPDANRGSYSMRKKFSAEDEGRWSFAVWSKNRTSSTIISITVKDNNSTPISIIIPVIACLFIAGLVATIVFFVRRYPHRFQRVNQMLLRARGSSGVRSDNSLPSVSASDDTAIYSSPVKKAFGRRGCPGTAIHGDAISNEAAPPGSRESHHYEALFSTGRVRQAVRFFASLASSSRPLDLESPADPQEPATDCDDETYLTPCSVHSTPTTRK